MRARRTADQAEALRVLHTDYERLKPAIEARLSEFAALQVRADDFELFRELVFCLFTPQSRATSCWAAVERVCDAGMLMEGPAENISECMSGVRFHHTKARRVVAARPHAEGLKRRILGFPTSKEAREWLVDSVDGMSYKEASHFLRNIGMGKDLAILDRHILKNLVLLGVIPAVPRHLSPQRYLDIEAKVSGFCAEAEIPMDHLDMVLWAREAGEIFK